MSWPNFFVAFFNNKTTTIFWPGINFDLSFFHKVSDSAKLFQEYLPKYAALAHLILHYLVLELTPFKFLFISSSSGVLTLSSSL